MGTSRQLTGAASPTIVVISYAHGSASHERAVAALADLLVSQGIEVIFDQWMGEQRRQLDNWFLHEVRRCDFVLAIASERYKRAADGDAPPDDLRGAQSETLLLRDLLQGDRTTWEPRILPVVLPGQRVADIPAFLHPYIAMHYRVAHIDAEGATDLLTVLAGPPAPPSDEQPHHRATALTAVGERTTASALAGGSRLPGQGCDAERDAAELVIDDVLVEPAVDHVVLDVRVRNSGTRTANITRLMLRVVERKRYLAAYPSTATYQLMLDGERSETKVAHVVEADGVDRFEVKVGFVPSEVGYQFSAEVTVRFNGGREAVSKLIQFDSCFG